MNILKETIRPPAAPTRVDRRVRVHRLLSFELMTRWAILSTSTVTCILGWFSPMSLTAVLLLNGGAIGHLVLQALTVAVALGWLDVFLSDIIPTRFAIQFLKRNRHLGYSLIGGIYMLQTFVSVGNTVGPEDLLAFGYILNAFVCGWFAWTTAWRGWHV